MSQNDETPSTSATRPSDPLSSTSELSNEQRQVIDKCTSVVQDFRSGKTSKSRVSLLLQQSIPHDDSNEDIFWSTYNTYFDMLNNFKRYRRGNVGRVDDVHQQIANFGTGEQVSTEDQPTVEVNVTRAPK